MNCLSSEIIQYELTWSIQAHLISILIFSASSALAQQQYSGNSVSSCNHNDETGPSPAFLYTCNGERPSCEAFLMFRTEPPDISVSSIANLMSCDPMELARVNKISSKAVMPPEEEVIVPVNRGLPHVMRSCVTIHTINSTCLKD